MACIKDYSRLADELPDLARVFGFEHAGVAGIDLAEAENGWTAGWNWAGTEP